MTPTEVARAFLRNGSTVYLDGRNEHGTHVLPALPTSIDHKDIEAALSDSAEEIMSAAEKLGFKVGDTIWVNFRWVRGDESDGYYSYYEYEAIDEHLSRLMALAWKSNLLAHVRPRIVSA